jgi:hypothetical protein
MHFGGPKEIMYHRIKTTLSGETEHDWWFIALTSGFYRGLLWVRHPVVGEQARFACHGVHQKSDE